MENFNYFIADEIINACIAEDNNKKKFTLSIPGGDTPSGVWPILLKDSYKSILDRKIVHLFWNDERIVKKMDRENNFNQVFNSFLNNYEAINTHRIKAWLDPKIMEKDYKKRLQRETKSVKSIPQLDLVFMGMGSDGHIASLFPYSNLLKENKKYISTTKKEYNGSRRVSLTFPILNNSKNIILAIKGKNKYDLFSRIIDDNNIYKYPLKGVIHNLNDTKIVICKK